MKNKNINIYVDDIRDIPNEFEVCFRTPEIFLGWLKSNIDAEINILSLDHDMGAEHINGYELVKEIVELNPKIKTIILHSDNPIGKENMFMYLKNAKEHGLISNIEVVVKY